VANSAAGLAETSNLMETGVHLSTMLNLIGTERGKYAYLHEEKVSLNCRKARILNINTYFQEAQKYFKSIATLTTITTTNGRCEKIIN